MVIETILMGTSALLLLVLLLLLNIHGKRNHFKSSKVKEDMKKIKQQISND
jgi:hypothetical protein